MDILEISTFFFFSLFIHFHFDYSVSKVYVTSFSLSLNLECDCYRENNWIAALWQGNSVEKVKMS